MYTPVCILGYFTYGGSLRDSVINSLQKDWIQQTVNLLITVHCILTLTIVFNPLNQEIEEIFNVPQSEFIDKALTVTHYSYSYLEFGPKRVIIRTGMMVAVVFVAESVPTFGPLLDLMGGSTLTLTSVVLPALFYIYLTAGEKKAAEKSALRGFSTEEDSQPVSVNDLFKYSNPITLGICMFIIGKFFSHISIYKICSSVFGFCGGAAATYSAIKELATTHFAVPCYVLPFVNSDSANSDQSTNCCGHYQNITAHSGITCSKPELDFYS